MTLSLTDIPNIWAERGAIKTKKRGSYEPLSGCRNNAEDASRPVPCVDNSKIRGLMVSAGAPLLI
jgi:hypothetical protein